MKTAATPQFGASLTDDARVIFYDRNIFIRQATIIKDHTFYLRLVVATFNLKLKILPKTIFFKFRSGHVLT